MAVPTPTAERPTTGSPTSLGPGVVLGLAAAAFAVVLVDVGRRAGAEPVVAVLLLLVAGAGLRQVVSVGLRAGRGQVTGAVAFVMAVYAAGSTVAVVLAAQAFL